MKIMAHGKNISKAFSVKTWWNLTEIVFIFLSKELNALISIDVDVVNELNTGFFFFLNYPGIAMLCVFLQFYDEEIMLYHSFH